MDGRVDFAVVPHQLRHWDDGATRCACWRSSGGCSTTTESPCCGRSRAPRSASVNAAWTTLLYRVEMDPPTSAQHSAELGQLAYDAGFAWVQTLPLRPFLFPPGPRLTILVRKEHYTSENVGQRVHEEAGASGL